MGLEVSTWVFLVMFTHGTHKDAVAVIVTVTVTMTVTVSVNLVTKPVINVGGVSQTMLRATETRYFNVRSTPGGLRLQGLWEFCFLIPQGRR